ncbi:MAG TPA: hypothetical protein VJ436_13995 [Anaerolineales bacterium]|nr:hypothetical protein [Anaerolineales bacterium]
MSSIPEADTSRLPPAAKLYGSSITFGARTLIITFAGKECRPPALTVWINASTRDVIVRQYAQRRHGQADILPRRDRPFTYSCLVIKNRPAASGRFRSLLPTGTPSPLPATVSDHFRPWIIASTIPIYLDQLYL